MAVFRRRISSGGVCPLQGLVVDYESAVLPVTIPSAVGYLDVDTTNHLWVLQAPVTTLPRPWVWGSYNPHTAAITVAGTKAGLSDGCGSVRLIPSLQAYLTFHNSGGANTHGYGSYASTGEPTPVGTIAATSGGSAQGGVVDPGNLLWWSGTDSGAAPSLQHGHITAEGVPVSDGTYASELTAEQFIPFGIDTVNHWIYVYRSDTGGTQVLTYDVSTGAITGVVNTLSEAVHDVGIDNWAWSAGQPWTADQYPLHLAAGDIDYLGGTAMPWRVLAADHEAKIAFGLDVATNSICAGFYCG